MRIVHRDNAGHHPLYGEDVPRLFDHVRLPAPGKTDLPTKKEVSASNRFSFITVLAPLVLASAMVAMAEDYGAQMNIHMAESPIACMAAVHVAAATRNFMSLELHSVDVPWWGDLVAPALRYDGGFIAVPDAPGLGIESLNEGLIKEHSCADFPEPWAPTTEWDKEWANDRRWS